MPTAEEVIALKKLRDAYSRPIKQVEVVLTHYGPMSIARLYEVGLISEYEARTALVLPAEKIYPLVGKESDA